MMEAEGEKRGIKLGRAEGEKRGITLGRKEEKFATARRMLDDGMSPEQVARLTVLPIEEVSVLKKR